jgi:hypothetical protein
LKLRQGGLLLGSRYVEKRRHTSTSPGELIRLDVRDKYVSYLRGISLAVDRFAKAADLTVDRTYAEHLTRDDDYKDHLLSVGRAVDQHAEISVDVSIPAWYIRKR